jgi:pimeloyl-ACP methyl ester carboxylesterase
MEFRRHISVVALLLLSAAATSLAKTPRWQTLPTPPALPSATSSGDVESAGVDIHYATFGDAKAHPIVVLHGGLGSAQQMSWQISALKDSHFVIAVDSRGQGQSEPTADGIHYAQMADDVIAVLDAISITEPAAVVGWSDGGVIGLQLAIRYPTRIAALVLLGTNYNLAGMKNASITATFTKYYEDCAQQWKQFGVTAKAAMPVRAALRVMWRTEPKIDEAALANITVPVVVALGDHDELIRTAHAKRLATLVKAGKFVSIADASHFALWQAPKETNKVIIDLVTAIWKL